VADKFYLSKAYLNYWLDAVDEHSLHSPFFFDFYTRIIKSKNAFTGISSIEKLRSQLLKDTRTINPKDLGTGASNGSRRIADIAHAAMSPVKLSGMYLRILQHLKAKTIFELGTSFGINTLYLAQDQSAKVFTFEGSPEIADIAQLTFEFAESKNVQLVLGNLDSTLTESIQSVRKIDFILIDANHRYGPTVRYFNRLLGKITEHSIIVIDDIHYSAEMEKAWNEIKGHKLVYGSADLFRCGILFFDPSLNKQHVILQV
jgi:predicted O-methyltransferase YrrM